MRETKHFDMFGRKYRTLHFAAVQGFALMHRENLPPDVLLSCTEALDPSGEWVRLDNAAAINAQVSDIANLVPAASVLFAVMKVVEDHNFSFIAEFQPTKIPRRFVDKTEPIRSSTFDPIVATLITEDIATLRELEEYYSLCDAVYMFDVMVASNVNDAVSQERVMNSPR